MGKASIRTIDSERELRMVAVRIREEIQEPKTEWVTIREDKQGSKTLRVKVGLIDGFEEPDLGHKPSSRTKRPGIG